MYNMIYISALHHACWLLLYVSRFAVAVAVTAPCAVSNAVTASDAVAACCWILHIFTMLWPPPLLLTFAGDCFFPSICYIGSHVDDCTLHSFSNADAASTAVAVGLVNRCFLKKSFCQIVVICYFWFCHGRCHHSCTVATADVGSTAVCFLMSPPPVGWCFIFKIAASIAVTALCGIPMLKTPLLQLLLAVPAG